MIWRAHLLSPAAYAKDCAWLLEAAGLTPRPIDHTPRAVGDYDCSSMQRPQPVAAVPEPADGTRSPLVASWRDGLVRAVRRQQLFMRQMVDLHTAGAASPQHLAAELEPYRCYLMAAAAVASDGGSSSSADKTLAVPSLTLDLIWHTHMLHPCSYARDCLEVCGTLIDHDDDSPSPSRSHG